MSRTFASRAPLRLSRRHALASAGALLTAGSEAFAFGGAGAFHPRVLTTGGLGLSGARKEAPNRWAWELVRRTSAPGRIASTPVAADNRKLLAEPFAIWSGASEIPELTHAEVKGLREFLKLGGILVVDDAEPERGTFGTAARRELRRVLPESPVVKLSSEHVVYKTYYILDRPVGRLVGPPKMDAIVRGKNAQVLLLSHDLLGALARGQSGWAMQVEPRQRQQAIRLAVNIAMYVLCSDYKDDQVHAPWLMRRRARRNP